MSKLGQRHQKGQFALDKRVCANTHVPLEPVASGFLLLVAYVA